MIKFTQVHTSTSARQQEQHWKVIFASREYFLISLAIIDFSPCAVKPAVLWFEKALQHEPRRQ